MQSLTWEMEEGEEEGEGRLSGVATGRCCKKTKTGLGSGREPGSAECCEEEPLTVTRKHLEPDGESGPGFVFR